MGTYGGRRRHRRSFFRRHRKLAVGLFIAAGLLGGVLAVLLLEAATGGIDYLKEEEIVTGNSGKKYTVPGAVDRVIEKGQGE